MPTVQGSFIVDTLNSVLSALSDADAALLAPHLELVDLPREHRLERRGREPEYIYFLEGGIACTTSDDAGGQGVQVGIVGREGFVGVPAVLSADRSVHNVQMLTAGSARRASARAVRDAMEASPSLRKTMLGYVLNLLLQVMREAQTNARETLDSRLARWLLMMHDRADGNELSLTHDRLAVLLGVRRAGVSVAAKKLERHGAITLHRGALVVLDRKRLEEDSNGAYADADRVAFEARA